MRLTMGAALLVGLLAWPLVPGLPAHAQSHGGLAGHALWAADERYGVAAMADFWFLGERTRLGAASGLVGLSGRGELSSWVLTPLAVSLASHPAPGRSGMAVRLRAGGYGGTRKGGFGGGAFVSFGAGYQVALGAEAGALFGLSTFWLSGRGQAAWLSPWLGLTF